jgi:PAS domain S-box-containing protein
MTNRRTVVDVPPTDLDFRHLVEESLAGIYLVQGDRFLYVNPTMAQLFGYSAEEIVRERSVEDLVAPSDRARVSEKLRQRLAGEIETLQYTFRGQRSDGTTFDVEVRGRRTVAEGRPAVIGTLLDITDRKRERERLRFLARAAELLDSSLDYEVTLESLARLMIPSFADLCFIDIMEGRTVRRLAASIEGAPELEEVELGVDTYRAWPEPRASAGAEERGILHEAVSPPTRREVLSRLRFRGRPEPPRIRSMIAVPLAARGNAIGSMTLMTTISGRSYDAADLEFAREVARGAALAVDNARLYRESQIAIQRREEILAIVSHDLRNSLNVILMATAMGLEADRRQQGPLEAIHGAAKQMEHLITDLLDLSAIEAGGFSVKQEPRPLEPLIRNSVSMHESLAESRGVRLVNEVGDASIVALVDETRVTQAVGNLLGNAIKFTPEKGSVRIALEEREERAVLIVQDSGPGIPLDQVESVFDRFWKGDAGSLEGAGLGLAIVRGIAVAHGGDVRVESTPGKGSTFYLELPLA